MNAREKKLSVLVLIAFIFAVGDFLYSAINEGKTESVTVSKLKEAKEAVSQMGGKLAALPMTNEGRRRLVASSVALETDPLEPAPAAVRSQADRALPFISVDGFVHTDRVRYVILGGKEYVEGDTVVSTGETVDKIEDNAVELSLTEGGKTVRRRLTAREAE